MTRTAVVLGDITLDVWATMTDRFDTAVVHEGATDGQASLALGGTGVGMARALVPYFDHVQLIGAIGDDTAGHLVAGLLQREPFAALVTTKHQAETSVVVVIRDTPRADRPHGDRVVVAHRGANDKYSSADLADVTLDIETAALLCVDGYGLLNEPRRTATLRAMQQARSAGVEVFLDLVPHDLFRHWTPGDCQRFGTDATIIGSSAATLAHLVGYPWPDMEPLDHATTLQVAEMATNQLGPKTYLLHFGAGHCTETMAYETEPLWYEQTNYPNLPVDQLRGFGDRLAAHELNRLLRRDHARPPTRC